MNDNYEQWKEMGNEIKDIRNRIITLMCRVDNQELLTKDILALLDQAVSRIDKFRNRADSRIFIKVKPGTADISKWCHVFYGRDEIGGSHDI